jgi:hypothetical protein
MPNQHRPAIGGIDTGLVLTAMPPIGPSTPIDAPMPIDLSMPTPASIAHACGVGVAWAGGGGSGGLPRLSPGEILIGALSLMTASFSRGRQWSN